MVDIIDLRDTLKCSTGSMILGFTSQVPPKHSKDKPVSRKSLKTSDFSNALIVLKSSMSDRHVVPWMPMKIETSKGGVRPELSGHTDMEDITISPLCDHVRGCL